ncbi:IMPACT family protein [Leifsonia aquatica]|uniref:YigZ family protein n=2 Tax=Leifsonia aquatica TaxID=144185 RepID=U2T411_LEIAQ|nr:YigZ family protein [Leifsonia aquatica]ERK72238.1 YigZ family protein [Leifsonia aquatica ATCC 14665]MBB2967020.1 putative YigZ family protein [Leifsonia aquatica]
MPHTLAAPAQAELEVRRSRFLAVALPVSGREEATEQIARLRAEHPGANHVCWALLAGGHSGMSDDGEPSGTAGRPILEVLRHHDLEDVLGAVVRYFGGVKLGAGGLVRAYTDAIATALLDAEVIERIPETTLAVTANYADAERIRRWADGEGFTVPDAAYGESVRLTLVLPEARCTEAVDTIRDLTGGRAHPED